MLNQNKLSTPTLCITLLATFSFIGAFTGCEGGVDPQTVDNLSRQIDALVKKGDETIQAVRNSSSDDALDELKKLRQWEYRTVKVPLSTTVDEHGALLNSLGSEGWECFDTVIFGEDLAFFCKRRPLTPLRFVPNSVLGR